jgi:mRNA-degrading endonuclease toxin of MazEF toxin-antitoxin module
MTSNLKDEPFSFVLTNAELGDGSLNRPSRVRADKVFTLAQSIIAARFGRVNAPTLDRIRQLVADVMR